MGIGYVTLFLLIVCIGTSVLVMNDPEKKGKLMLYPYQMNGGKESYRFLSHMIIHGDWMHLIFNMYVLYIFSNALETDFTMYYGVIPGRIYLVSLFILGGFFSSIYSYVKQKDNPGYRSLGASGAVAAVMFVSIICFPDLKLGFFLFPVDIPGYIFALIYLASEYIMSVRGKTNIGHDAHISGAIFGILFIFFLDGSRFVDFYYYIFG